MSSSPVVLASDIDNTLTGDSAVLNDLREKIDKLRRDGKLYLFLSTGRRLDQVIEGMDQEGIPEADAVISQVGTEIYLPPFSEETPCLEAWEKQLLSKYDRETALGLISDIEGLELQPDKFNTPLKLSCYLDKAPDPEGSVETIRSRIREKGLEDGYQVVWSSGRDLDILPAEAGKGKAIRFLVNYLNLDTAQVLVAGDSGNDSSMFAEFERGIAVGNAKPELREFCSSSAVKEAFIAEKEYAAGVAEGLAHFGVLSS